MQLSRIVEIPCLTCPAPISLLSHFPKLACVSQSDARPTGDQEVACSILAGSGNVLLWRLIMKYFLRSVSPFC